MKRHNVCAIHYMDNVFGKTLSGSRSLDVDDLTIGTVSITQRYSTVPYSITLPQTQGSASMILVNDGSGNLTWAYPSVSPPITGILPVLNGGTGVTQSTGTEKVVLYRSPTFADNITVPTIKGGGIDGSLDITTGLNTSAILSIQSANIIGLTAPSIYIGPTRYPSATGTAGQYLRTGAPASGFATSTWTTIPISETTGTLPTTRGGTGLTSVGLNGEFLASNGTSLYWETAEQIGIMRYKQMNYPYIYLIPPAGMQLWNGFGNIDFRTLYPVAGEQLGLALDYENFGRFTNNYPYPIIASIEYSAARFVAAIPFTSIPGYSGPGEQLNSFLPILSDILNGQSYFWLEKNNNGDQLASSFAPGGAKCTGSFNMVLQPGDFFQLRGYNNCVSVCLINVESEITIKLQSYGASTIYAPSAPGSGTVTSVNIASPDSFFAVGGGPITTNGTLSVGLSGTPLPTFVGGTGLVNVGSNGTVLTSNGTALSWQTPAPPGSGTVTSINTSTSGAPFLTISGGPITSTGTLSFGLSGSALPTSSGGTGSSDASTGTGGVVLRTSPTFTTSINTPQVTGSGAGGDLGIISTGTLFLNSTNYMSIVSPSYLDIRGGFGGTNDIFITSTRDVALTATRDILLSAPTTKVSTVLTTPAIVGSGVSGLLAITSTGVVSTIADDYLFMASKSYLDIRGGFTGTNDIFMSATRNIFISSTSALVLGGNSYPQVTGSNGQVLTTDGAGGITWQTPPGAGGGGGVSSVGLVSAAPFITVTGSTIVASGVFSLSIGTLGTANGGTGLTTVGATGTVLTSNGTSLLWTSPGTGTVTNVGFSSSNSFITASGGGITGTGTLSVGIAGALPPANGGTGLSVVGTTGQVLTSNGTTLAWQTPSTPGTGTVTSVNISSSNSFITTSGGPVTTTGTLSVGINGVLPTSNGGTGSSDASTGTGGVVLRTSPTFVTKLTTPEVAGSGVSNDLAITSDRNITLTGGIGNGIFLNTALYARNKIVGDTGGDFIIENPSSFIFLNPGYSVRTGGMAFHAESANNQTFTGTVIGDQTIRSDSNLWIGPGGFSRLQLVGNAGIYARDWRVDTPRGGAYHMLQPDVTLFNNTASSVLYDTTPVSTQGSRLTVELGGEGFLNPHSMTVWVTVSWAAQRNTDDTATGKQEFWIEHVPSTTRYGFQRENGLVSLQNTCSFALAFNESFRLMAYQNSGFPVRVNPSGKTAYFISYTYNGMA